MWGIVELWNWLWQKRSGIITSIAALMYLSVKISHETHKTTNNADFAMVLQFDWSKLV